MNTPMGRRRQTNLDLPPHMHVKAGTFYYVTSTTPRKWISLGKDMIVARKKWAALENGTDQDASVPALVDAYLESAAFAELAANTRKQYKSVAAQLKDVFESVSVVDVKPHHVAQWLDNHKSPVNANTGRSVLVNAFNIAIRRGMIERNPAKEVENLTVKRRDRYLTDAEYQAIRAEANPVLRAAMDVAYVIGARISDVLSIKLSQWTADGLMIRQKKTGKLQLFERTQALEKAIENAKKIDRPVRGLYLLCTKDGRPYAYNTVSNWWRIARDKAGVTNAHFHDIRGKSATDAKGKGQDYQALLGHTTKAMSDSYIKLEEAQRVEPLKKML